VEFRRTAYDVALDAEGQTVDEPVLDAEGGTVMDRAGRPITRPAAAEGGLAVWESTEVFEVITPGALKEALTSFKDRAVDRIALTAGGPVTVRVRG